MKKQKKSRVRISDLRAEISRLRLDNKEWSDGSERRRKEFAKAFNWIDGRSSYGNETYYRCPSWEEIFTQIGKLTERRHLLNIEEKNKRLDSINNRLKEELIKLREKK